MDGETERQVEIQPSVATMPEGLSLDVVLARVANELDGAASQLKAVQDALALLPDGSLPKRCVVAFQGLDLLEQTMGALADIVAGAARLSEAVPQSFPRGPLDDCRLSGLADRLRGIDRPSEAAALEIF